MVKLRRGQKLEVRGRNCFVFWIIVSGSAAICTSFADGRRQITGIEMPGDIICGLIDTDEEACWLEALEESRICVLDFSADAMALRQNPDFLTEMFKLTHNRLETAMRHLSTLGRLDSTERVLLFLAQMALRKRRTQHNDAPVRLKMTREDIADYLGLNPETVSRIFSRVKKTGLIKFLSPTEYLVPDMEAIKHRLPVLVDPGGIALNTGGHPHKTPIREVRA
ncbi:Crp/Fnr family transcriptional regulator [Rhodobacteraceae bacterium LMO-12]|nr:Crp/Fnr family transcriptional regulator [Rhodobacteraceae bacterium LMO-JJ12]